MEKRMITANDNMLDEMYEEMETPLNQELLDIIDHFDLTFNVKPVHTVQLLQMHLDTMKK